MEQTKSEYEYEETEADANQISSPVQSSFSKKFFKFFGNTLGLKNMLSKTFIYHQPNPTYLFKEQENSNGTMSYSFQLKKEFIPQHNDIPNYITYDLYMMNFRNKLKKDCAIPIMHIINQKTLGNQVLIYNHGNSSDLGTIFYSLINMSKIYKVNIVAYDYRGYGISKGDINEENTYEDCEMVMSFTLYRLKYRIYQLILWGFSLGSGPAVHLAAKYQYIRALILEAPLASVYLFLENEPSSQYNDQEGDVYGNIYKIGKVRSSIMIMHGKSDEVIPYKHSQILLEKFQQENPNNKKQIQCLLVEELKHNDLKSLIQIKKSLTATKLKQFLQKMIQQTQFDMEYYELNPQLYKILLREEEDLSFLNILHKIRYKVDF
ncbi:hypothetical protein ABPG74_017078 [Tetrahymena malaccensis]